MRLLQILDSFGVEQFIALSVGVITAAFIYFAVQSIWESRERRKEFEELKERHEALVGSFQPDIIFEKIEEGDDNLKLYLSNYGTGAALNLRFGLYAEARDTFSSDELENLDFLDRLRAQDTVELRRPNTEEFGGLLDSLMPGESNVEFEAEAVFDPAWEVGPDLFPLSDFDDLFQEARGKHVLLQFGITYEDVSGNQHEKVSHMTLLPGKTDVDIIENLAISGVIYEREHSETENEGA